MKKGADFWTLIAVLLFCIDISAAALCAGAVPDGSSGFLSFYEDELGLMLWCLCILCLGFLAIRERVTSVPPPFPDIPGNRAFLFSYCAAMALYAILCIVSLVTCLFFGRYPGWLSYWQYGAWRRPTAWAPAFSSAAGMAGRSPLS